MARESTGTLSEVSEEAQRIYDDFDPMDLLAKKVSSTMLSELADGLRENDIGADAEDVITAAAEDLAKTVEGGVGTNGTLHRPCAACRKSRVRCDYLQPCTRCVRLGIGHECAPPPDVKRGRPKGALQLSAAKPGKGQDTPAATPGKEQAAASGKAKATASGKDKEAGKSSGTSCKAPTPPPPPLPVGNGATDKEWPALPSRASSLSELSYAVTDPPLEGRSFRRGARQGVDARERTWQEEEGEGEGECGDDNGSKESFNGSKESFKIGSRRTDTDDESFTRRRSGVLR